MRLKSHHAQRGYGAAKRKDFGIYGSYVEGHDEEVRSDNQVADYYERNLHINGFNICGNVGGISWLIRT